MRCILLTSETFLTRVIQGTVHFAEYETVAVCYIYLKGEIITCYMHCHYV